MTEDNLLSPDQVAGILGVNTKTLTRWRGKQFGPRAIRLTQRIIRYRRSEVDDWIDQIEGDQAIEAIEKRVIGPRGR